MSISIGAVALRDKDPFAALAIAHKTFEAWPFLERMPEA